MRGSKALLQSSLPFLVLPQLTSNNNQRDILAPNHIRRHVSFKQLQEQVAELYQVSAQFQIELDP